MSKEIKLLLSDADAERLAPVLAELRKKGLRPQPADTFRKNDTVLAVLSEAFYGDEEKTGALLGLIGAGAENLLPLRLDAEPVPEALMNALYARNIIPAQGRDAALLAERIVAALPQKKSRLPLLLTAGAVVLAAVAGLLIWRAAQPKEAAVPVMEEQEIVIPAAYGLTQEDLDKILHVSFISDQAIFLTEDDLGKPYPHPVTYHMEEDGMHWDSTEDGHRLSAVKYAPEDLAFLKLLPNLRSLEMVLADTEALPDLRGLTSLRSVVLADCTITDLSGLAESSLEFIGLFRCPIEDYSVLSSCQKLTDCEMEFEFLEQADLSGFAPPALEWAEFRHGPALREMDLSGLAACPKLRILKLQYGLPVQDISFLRMTPALEELTLEDLPVLQSISDVGTLRELKNLYVGYCPRITDYTPIAGCIALESIHVQGDLNPDALRDASFLADLPKLQDIGLYSCNLNNMDFLEGIAAHQSSISLGFAGGIRDYSGLAVIRKYDYLHVNPRGQNGNRGGDYSAVQPYIQDAQVEYLMLYTCSGVDLSTLPEGIRNLSIRYGDLTDLTGLKSYPLQRLELWDCPYLTSIDGLESIPTLAGGGMELEIVGCPRLTDFDALDGAELNAVKLTGIYTLPDFGRFRMNSLCLDSIPELTDLHVLDGLAPDRTVDLSLVGQDELRDLTPLRRLKGGHLTVPPQVAEQAEELVEEGVFESWEVAYPDGSWEPDDSPVTLLSLEELQTLPKALLRRVERLCLIGDTLVDLDGCDIREDWQDGRDTPVLMLHNHSSDESVPIEYGAGVVTDLAMFSALTGLRELQLYAQPLESLDGVQNLAALENLAVRWCPELTDISAAFASPQLRYLTADNCPAASIRGVQNLQELRGLNINHTRVTDLSPLAALDYAAAEEEGGFSLWMNDVPAEDYSPLSAIPTLDSLDANDAPAGALVPALEKTAIRRLAACSVFLNQAGEDPDALFADFIAAHPGLRELWIPWNPGITDLTPVLALEELEYVRVSRNMEKAIASLDGQDFGFELEIEG